MEHARRVHLHVGHLIWLAQACQEAMGESVVLTLELPHEGGKPVQVRAANPETGVRLVGLIVPMGPEKGGAA